MPDQANHHDIRERLSATLRLAPRDAAIRDVRFCALASAGHAPFLDQPAAFVREVEAFLGT